MTWIPNGRKLMPTRRKRKPMMKKMMRNMRFIFKGPTVKRRSWTLNSASTNLALDPEHRIVEDVVVVADAVADVDAVVVTVANAETVATVETAVNVVVVASVPLPPRPLLK